MPATRPAVLVQKISNLRTPLRSCPAHRGCNRMHAKTSQGRSGRDLFLLIQSFARGSKAIAESYCVTRQCPDAIRSSQCSATKAGRALPGQSPATARRFAGQSDAQRGVRRSPRVQETRRRPRAWHQPAVREMACGSHCRRPHSARRRAAGVIRARQGWSRYGIAWGKRGDAAVVGEENCSTGLRCRRGQESCCQGTRCP
ncbi:MAG: hypothetical protein AW07_01279 [Candidatus Accumulibacter sp. SK-11]|nr:MAG: hypothetical protein AW07_01279 [Candidatus Accumulibacter sp. SK-11]